MEAYSIVLILHIRKSSVSSPIVNYVNFQNQATNDEISNQINLVKKLAFSVKKKLPAEVEVNDLIQSGMMGLLEAKRNFDENYGVNFDQFAFIRIKGAMIDFLRKNSWLNKETTKKNKLIGNALENLKKRGDVHPSSELVAAEMGVSVEQYHKMSSQVNQVRVLNIEDYSETLSEIGQPCIEETLFIEQMRGKIKTAISGLVERDQIILSMYYNDELTFKQIAQILNLTEARICQIHSKTIEKIRKQIPIEQELAYG